MKQFYGKTLAVIGGTAAFIAAPFAHAAIDVSDVVTQITGDGTTAVAAIGAAVLGLIGVVLVYKLVRRAM